MTTRAAMVPVLRPGRDGLDRVQDLVAVETPVLLRVRDTTGRDHEFGLLMRTPGHDEDLVIGLLRAEGLVRDAAEVLDIAIDAPDGGDAPATIVVTVPATADLRARLASRATAMTSACGLCGRVEWLRVSGAAGPLAPDGAWSIDLLASLPDRLATRQPVFDETGGLHAAGVFDAAGTLLVAREDVGRHNAVDKAIGGAWRAGHLPAAGRLLAVSGRVAYEIVQKAAAAGLDGVVAVGAPSSLAVEAARAADLVLAGFARGGRCNVYAGHRHVR